MAYQSAGPIQTILDRIHRAEYVLPAIQREFVWDDEKICKFFDSVLQGYPIGDFLFWSVEADTSHKHEFYRLMRRFSEYDSFHCESLGTLRKQRLTAVLDGQQRLTAFNIGLRGSLARRLHGRKRSDPKSYPETFLVINVVSPTEPDDEGCCYRFSFRDRKTIESPPPGCVFFEVSHIPDYDSESKRSKWLDKVGLGGHLRDRAADILEKLYHALHVKEIVEYHEETSQDVDRVLQIFVRTNSGGAALTHSDLLLSVAVSKWKNKNAREEVHSLTGELNNQGIGFGFSKDHVLKAGLMMSDLDVSFKLENFEGDNMSQVEQNWDGIRHSMVLAVKLLSQFGYGEKQLSSHNAALPIAYYLYRRGVSDSYLDHSCFTEDRRSVSDWLSKSLLKKVWGGSSDTLLNRLRKILDRGLMDSFPVEDLSSRTSGGIDLTFDGDDIEELVDLAISNPRIHAVLLLLYPGFDMRLSVHIDHIFPKREFHKRNLRKYGIRGKEASLFKQKAERVGNLQFLEAKENIEKGDTLPLEWLSQLSDEQRRDWLIEHNVLHNIPADVGGFSEFYRTRREEIRAKIAQLLGRPELK